MAARSGERSVNLSHGEETDRVEAVVRSRHAGITSAAFNLFSHPPPVSTMTSKSQRTKEKDTTLSALNVSIDALNLAKESSSVTPAETAFSSVSALLAMIKDSIPNEQDYVDLGLFCADVCNALDRGLKGKKSDELSTSVLEAIGRLTA